MKRALSLEMRNAIRWLEIQPEVSSVVQARYVASKHKHAPGFTKVLSSDKKSVHLRTFDKQGSKDLFVYAKADALRDRWVAALVSGHVFDEKNTGPKLASRIEPVVPMGDSTSSIAVPTPKPINEKAGQIFNVTPDLAVKWLERNTRNRDLRDDVVQRYAGDMKAGRWMVTGDAVGFDKDGAIVNGQHRLWAVVESNMTIPMLVTFNLEPEVVRVLDDHLKRRLTDIVKIAKPGSSITTKMTSVGRVMQNASITLLSSDKRASIARLSRQQQIEFLEKHYDAINFAVRECFKGSTTRGLTTATVLGVIARAYYSEDKERLQQFSRILLSGIVEDPKADVAAILLRNWLMSLSTASMRPAAEVVYRKTERALKAFCKRETLKMLHETSIEMFYLPEDKPPKKKSVA